MTAYSNTWALGALQPGQTATFDWGVTAVKAGTYVVQYRVAAGLNGKAKAVRRERRAAGAARSRSRSTQRPQQAYVNNQGQVVTGSSSTVPPSGEAGSAVAVWPSG